MYRIYNLLGLFLLFSSSNLAFSQSKTNAYCWSTKGVNIREKPTGKATLVGKIPYKGKATVLDTIHSSPYIDTLNGNIPVKGHWMKIQQGNVTGYVFNGYASLLQPQTFYQFFANLKEETTENTHTFKRADGSFYEYVVGEGCWEHTYFIKGGTLNDGLMLVSTTEPHEAEDCPLTFSKTDGNKYHLPSCGASASRILEVTKEGVFYRTSDCD